MTAIYTSFEAQSASIASTVFGPTGFPFPKGRHFQDDSLLVNSVKLCLNVPSMLHMVEQKNVHVFTFPSQTNQLARVFPLKRMDCTTKYCHLKQWYDQAFPSDFGL